MGEPFLNSEIVEMLKYCKKKGIVTETVSNGTVLREEALNYLDSLVFSFDAGSKSTFEKLRPGAHFDIIVNNIKKTVSLNTKTYVGMSIIVSKGNVQELHQFVDLACEIGVDYVTFPPVEQWVIKTQEYNSKRDQISNLFIDATKQIMEAETYARKAGLGVRYAPQGEWVSNCTWPWKSVFISHNGYVTPCCIRPDWRVYNFGNIFTTSFKDIWSSEQYQDFRKSLKTNCPTAVCRGCPS
jgi:radical SAM protein with 4Fe4S-binding SPASM domain